MALDDLIRKFCPIIYLHPRELFQPSSVEWWFERTRLTRQGAILLDPIGSWENVITSKVRLDTDCFMALCSDDYRCGDVTTAPVYVLTRGFMKDGSVRCYDISYWLFYPFNGNIFDGEKAGAVLGGAAAGLALLGPLSPVVFGTAATASTAAANWIGSNPQIGMHEGDWEHITVRTTESGELLAVNYNEHGAHHWFYIGQVNSPYGGRMNFPTEGTRPIVYSAVNSHASYPFVGRIQRLAGFADDATGVGYRIDPLDPSTPGYVLLNPGGPVPEKYGWVNFPGRWGRPGDEPGPVIQWVGEQVGEPLVAVGKGVSFSWLPDGDGNPNQTWDTSPAFIVVGSERIQARRILTAASIQEHIYIFYLDGDGKPQVVLFDSTYWSSLPPDRAKMFTGCDDVEVFQIGGRAHAVAVLNGSLLFAVQQNTTAGDFALQPWQPDVASIEPHILEFRCISPVGSDSYYATGGVGTKNVLVGFLRSDPSTSSPVLTILNFDGQHWTDVSPGDWFPNPIDTGSPLDIVVYDGQLIVSFRGPDRRTYFLSCVPTYATSGGLQNWQQLHVEAAAYTSLSMTVAKEMLCVAGRRADGALETCTVAGDPSKTAWGLAPMPGVTLPEDANVQLTSISTSETLLVVLPRTDGGVEYAATYEMMP